LVGKVQFHCVLRRITVIMQAAGARKALTIALIMTPGARHAADKEPKFMIAAREAGATERRKGVVRRFDNDRVRR